MTVQMLCMDNESVYLQFIFSPSNVYIHYIISNFTYVTWNSTWFGNIMVQCLTPEKLNCSWYACKSYIGVYCLNTYYLIYRRQVLESKYNLGELWRANVRGGLGCLTL